MRIVSDNCSDVSLAKGVRRVDLTSIRSRSRIVSVAGTCILYEFVAQNSASNSRILCSAAGDIRVSFADRGDADGACRAKGGEWSYGDISGGKRESDSCKAPARCAEDGGKAVLKKVSAKYTLQLARVNQETDGNQDEPSLVSDYHPAKPTRLGTILNVIRTQAGEL